MMRMMMSGNEESKLTVKEKLAAFEKAIDKHEAELPLLFPKCSAVEIEKALNLTEEDLKVMSDEDCAISAHTLSQYSLYLQKDINRNTTRANWARDNLNTLLAKSKDQYGDKWTKHEMKLAALCKGDSEAIALHDVLKHAEARITSLNNITMHISLICNTLLGLKSSKRRQQYDSARTN